MGVKAHVTEYTATCDRCGHIESVRSQRAPDGWERWTLADGPALVCPSCAPVVEEWHSALEVWSERYAAVEKAALAAKIATVQGWYDGCPPPVLPDATEPPPSASSKPRRPS